MTGRRTFYRDTDADAVRMEANRAAKNANQWAEGVVTVVNPSGTALVRFSGASNNRECEVMGNVAPTPSAHVVLFHSNVVDRWFILGTYTVQSITGNPAAAGSTAVATVAAPNATSVVAGYGLLLFTWTPSGVRSDLVYEIEVADDTSETGAVFIFADGAVLPLAVAGGTTKYFRIRGVDNKFNKSGWTAWASGTATSLPTDTDYYQTVQVDGSNQTQRPKLDLIAGTNVTLTPADDGAGSRTKITIDVSVPATLTVKEQDGVPTIANVNTIKVTNGTLTDEGSGVVSITTGGGGGGGGPSGGKMMQTRTVLYDNTLSSPGSWDVSSIDQSYEHLELILLARSTDASTQDTARVHFNNDSTASNYDAWYDYSVTTLPQGNFLANSPWLAFIPAASNPANEFTEIRSFIGNYTNTGVLKQAISNNAYRYSSSTSLIISIAAVWKSTSAINRIALACISGSFDTGSRLQIIGIKEELVGSVAPYILIRDEKAQNTSGGTFTSGAWRTRDLNAEVTDTDNLASVASNQIALAAGTYEARIRCPATAVNRHQARLYNVTDSAVLLLGTSEHSSSATYVSDYSEIVGRFTISGTKTLEVQHQCQATQATYGFGIEANFGTEIYTVVELRRVA